MVKFKFFEEGNYHIGNIIIIRMYIIYRIIFSARMIISSCAIFIPPLICIFTNSFGLMLILTTIKFNLRSTFHINSSHCPKKPREMLTLKKLSVFPLSPTAPNDMYENNSLYSPSSYLPSPPIEGNVFTSNYTDDELFAFSPFYNPQSKFKFESTPVKPIIGEQMKFPTNQPESPFNFDYLTRTPVKSQFTMEQQACTPSMFSFGQTSYLNQTPIKLPEPQTSSSAVTDYQPYNFAQPNYNPARKSTRQMNFDCNPWNDDSRPF